MTERTGTSCYGRRYWCIKTPTAVSKSGEIYLLADRLEVTAAGALICWGAFGLTYDDQDPDAKPEQVVLSLAPGKWIASYAASIMDGSPVAVDHWEGEVTR